MKRFYLCSVLMAVAIFCSCSTDITEESKVGSIAGSVSDRTTGEPVATVNVSISPGGSSTVTGSDGTFTFRNLEEGSYTLTITKEGYKQNSSTVTVYPGDPTSAHLLIERIPIAVTADREVLDFGSNASINTLSFNIVNPSYVDLEWEIEERCEWITEVKPSNGILAYGKTEGIVVVLDREKLEPGRNITVIVIRSSNGSGSSELTIKATNKSDMNGLNYIELEDVGIAVQKEDIGYGQYQSDISSLCKNSITGGYTDWRLPTIDELTTLYLNADNIGGFVGQKWPDGSYHWGYWSSTPVYENSNTYFYILNFSSGVQIRQATPSDGVAHSGRCVRTLDE